MWVSDLINKDWYGMFFACGIWCVAGVSSINLRANARNVSCTPHQNPQAKNIPYQPLLLEPAFSLLAYAQETVFFKTSLQMWVSFYRNAIIVCTKNFLLSYSHPWNAIRHLSNSVFLVPSFRRQLCSVRSLDILRFLQTCMATSQSKMVLSCKTILLMSKYVVGCTKWF